MDGELLLDVLKKAGVNTDEVKVLPDARSGNAIIQVDDEGNNCILLYGGSNRQINRQQIDEVLAKFDSGDYILLQNEISNPGYLIEKAHQKGMKIVLNPSPLDSQLLMTRPQLMEYYNNAMKEWR